MEKPNNWYPPAGPETCSNPVERAMIYLAQSTNEKGLLLGRNGVSIEDALWLYYDHSHNHPLRVHILDKYSDSQAQMAIKAIESIAAGYLNKIGSL